MEKRGDVQAGVGRRLLLFGVAVGLMHHVGLLTDAGTSRRDVLERLARPADALSGRGFDAGGPGGGAAGPHRLGSVAYVQGHGLHLAANCVANAAPGPTAHLWDEVVGHIVWYAGLGLILVALVRALDAVPIRVSPVGWVVALNVGLTVATNALAGGTVAGSLAGSLAFAIYGLGRHDALGRLLLATFGLATLVLLVGLSRGA